MLKAPATRLKCCYDNREWWGIEQGSLLVPYQKHNSYLTPETLLACWKGRISKWCEVTRSCPTLCNPVECSLPGSSVHGIFQTIVLEWIAISFSKQEKLEICILTQKWSMFQFSSVQSLSRVRLFVTPWAVAYQAPLSMGFSRQ